MRVLAVVNQDDAGPGVFGEVGPGLDTWKPFEEPAPEPATVDAAIVLGGAMNVGDVDQHPWLAAEKRFIAELLERGAPLLGVCLGSQLLAEAAGATVRRSSEPEIGWYGVELTEAGRSDPVVGGMPPRFDAFQWHSYEAPLPPGATELARSPVCLQAYRLGDLRAWGIQFHAEVDAATARSWIDGYQVDADAVRIGIDPEQLEAETADRIKQWNELGRGLARRFYAEAYSGVT